MVTTTGNILRDRVVLNISGTIFETKPETLARFPNTLLGDVKKRSQFYNNRRHEHFINRNSAAFDAILYYYQSGGNLVRPPHIPVDLFTDEVRFYQLGDRCVEKVLNGDKQEEEEDEEEEEILPEGKIRRKIWLLFEHPETSFLARVIAVVSISVIVISIAAFCIETLPAFRKKHRKGDASGGHDDHLVWFAIETGCIVWFTFEYVMRFASAPQKLKFARSFLNVIDIVAILPFYITLPLPTETVSSLGVLRVLRLVRVFRIFKLSRHSRGLQIVGMTLRSSFRELCLLVFFVFVGVIIFSSMLFFASGDQSLVGERGEYLSIPHIFWWAIITMTTVGYGDVWPDTPAGKVFLYLPYSLQISSPFNFRLKGGENWRERILNP